MAQNNNLRPTSAALVSELYGATRRLSRLHQALTLLSSIENEQFAQAVPVRLNQVVGQGAAAARARRGLIFNVAVTGVPALTLHPGLGLSIVQQIYRYYGFALSHEFSPTGSLYTLQVGFSPSIYRP